MNLAPFVPSAARIRLRTARQALTDAVRSRRNPPRPVFEQRHSEAELRELARRTASDGLRAGVRMLQVRDVQRTTADSVTIRFANPPDDPIRFRPGQFLTLEVEVDGTTHRRQYSFCSDPADVDEVAITVRRVPGGIVSGAVVDSVRPGDRFRTVGPSGRFGTEVLPGGARRVILVAGGAGITPLWSIALALTRREPDTRVELVYANRGVSRVILLEAIESLAKSCDRFSVTHVLQRRSKRLAAELGRLSGDVLHRALPADPDAEYFVCGPQPMMDGVAAYLRQSGVPEERVAAESFVPAGRRAAADDGVYAVRFARSGRTLEVGGDQTLLEAARSAGLDVSFSCTMGGCAACAVTLRSGDVAMDEPNCLTPDEAARGLVLACVARPRSPLVIEA